MPTTAAPPPPTQKQQLDAAWDRMKLLVNFTMPIVAARIRAAASKLR